MAPKSTSAAAKRKPRKRNRRAAASDSSDSSSSDGSSSSDEEAPLVPALQALRDAKGKGKEILLPVVEATVDAPLVGYAAVAAAAKARLEEESGSDSDSSSSSSSSGSSTRPTTTANTNSNPIQVNQHVSTRIIRPPRQSTSPSPPPSTIPAFLPFSNSGKPPSFLPPKKTEGGMDGVEEETSEEDLKKKKFREFWMGKLVKGFGEDLDVVRQEPTLTTPRLTLLIDSLTSGIDVFSTGSSGKPGDVDERDVVLGKI